MALLLLAGVATPSPASQEFHLTHDGVDRTYHLYVPESYRAGTPMPLVMALHGRGSSGEHMEKLTRFDARADAYGFIAVYPDGLDGAWDYVHGIPGYKPGPDDAGFLVRLVETLIERYDIDTRRIYVTGISNGGFMTQRLACYAPRRFAAFASVAASGYAAMPLHCEDYHPVNMLYIHGTADSHVPWEGLGVEGADGTRQLVTMSVKSSLQFWSKRDRCGPGVSTRELPRKGDSPGTLVRILTANGCEEGAEVSLYAVVGGGHNWPGIKGLIPPDIAGRVNMDIDASDVVLSFFRRNAGAAEPSQQ